MAATETTDLPADSIAVANTAPTRPKLKLTLKNPSRQGSFSAATPNPDLPTPSATQQSAGSAPPATPATEGQPKKIRLKPPTPSTPASGTPHALPPLLPGVAEEINVGVPEPSPVTKTKAGRTSKPTPKKRAIDGDDGDDEVAAVPTKPRPAKKVKLNGEDGARAVSAPTRPVKKIKISTPALQSAPGLPSATQPKSAISARPTVVVKPRGKKPHRPPGHGYDSEAEDREEDPVIEEQFILRMMPGEHCEYIRKAIQEKKIGVSRQQGGADIVLKWLDEQGRRACLTVEGQHYAGTLLDLPTITEGMKTWNKRNFVKSADICQMLLIFAKVNSEAEAKEVPLPAMAGKGYTWPHGLTPPMHDCVHRRFRKRLSKLEIKNKEEEVTRLLNADKSAVSSRWELVDDRPQQEYTIESDDEESFGDEEDAEGEADGEVDAEGEVDDGGYFGPVNGYRQEATLDAEAMANLEAEVEAEFEMDFDNDPDAWQLGGPGDTTTPATANGATPTGRADADVDMDDDDGDDDDDDDEELDDDAQARADEVKGVREDVAELRKQLTKLQNDLTKQGNEILRKRIEGNIKKVKSELQLKLSSIGEVFEE